MKLPWYTTREAVKADLDMKSTARSNAKVDRAIEGASRAIEAQMHRIFYPHLATHYFDHVSSWRLWLDEHEAISVSEVTSGGVVVPVQDYFLSPYEGPPYNSLDLNRGTNASWSTEDTTQRSIAVTGLFGWNDTHATVANLVSGVDADDTELTLTWTTFIGVGSLLRIGTERMVVTEKRLVDSGATLVSSLDSQAKTTLVSVPDGTDFRPDDVVLIDAEKMLVVDIAGNSLVVQRAWDGTVLASHTAGAALYVDRKVIVQRASVGSQAASHSLGATVEVWSVPGLLEELCSAEALNTLLQKSSGYARVTGEGENAREASGRALKDVRARAETAYRRWRS